MDSLSWAYSCISKTFSLILVIGTPALSQMKNNIRMLKKKFDDISWEYFKKFQKEMHAREHIPTEVVNRYEDSICFMVDTDTCLMEVVIPRTTWVAPMGYEVDKDLLVAYMLIIC